MSIYGVLNGDRQPWMKLLAHRWENRVLPIIRVNATDIPPAQRGTVRIALTTEAGARTRLLRAADEWRLEFHEPARPAASNHARSVQALLPLGKAAMPQEVNGVLDHMDVPHHQRMRCVERHVVSHAVQQKHSAHRLSSPIRINPAVSSLRLGRERLSCQYAAVIS